MKKVDILNFITDFRKAPNDVKSHKALMAHLGPKNEAQALAMISEMKQLRVIRELDQNGEKAYQVIAR